MTIPIDNVNACLRPSGQLTRSTLGPITLGLTRTRARQQLPHFTARSSHTDDFCLAGGSGIRVGYGSTRLLGTRARHAQIQRRIVLALTANPLYALNDVHPGTAFASARHLKLGKVIHLGLNNWYIIPGHATNGVPKVRHGQVKEIGTANPKLTNTVAAQARLLRNVWLSDLIPPSTGRERLVDQEVGRVCAGGRAGLGPPCPVGVRGAQRPGSVRGLGAPGRVLRGGAKAAPGARRAHRSVSRGAGGPPQ